MNRCKNDKADETRMIRFIDPNYREMFQIPDDAYVEVKYPNSTVIVACRYMDEYHLRFGSEVYHICELAERLERCQATCTPEPEITEDDNQWKLGNKVYLYVFRRRNPFLFLTFSYSKIVFPALRTSSSLSIQIYSPFSYSGLGISQIVK